MFRSSEISEIWLTTGCTMQHVLLLLSTSAETDQVPPSLESSCFRAWFRHRSSADALQEGQNSGRRFALCDFIMPHNSIIPRISLRFTSNANLLNFNLLKPHSLRTYYTRRFKIHVYVACNNNIYFEILSWYFGRLMFVKLLTSLKSEMEGKTFLFVHFMLKKSSKFINKL